MLVTLVNSPSGIQVSENTNLVFGFVWMINDLCDSVEVGEYVFFDITKANAIQYGSTIYYLVDEALKIFKDIPL